VKSILRKYNAIGFRYYQPTFGTLETTLTKAKLNAKQLKLFLRNDGEYTYLYTSALETGNPTSYQPNFAKPASI
jgi:hypothetical protein